MTKIIDLFIDTILRWGGGDVEVTREESSQLSSPPANTLSPTTPVPNTKPIAPGNPPISGVTIVYVRDNGVIHEAPVTYDDWWRPRVQYGIYSSALSPDGRTTLYADRWTHKSGPPIHFPTEKDLAEFFPPGHPERQPS